MEMEADITQTAGWEAIMAVLTDMAELKIGI